MSRCCACVGTLFKRTLKMSSRHRQSRGVLRQAGKGSGKGSGKQAGSKQAGKQAGKPAGKEASKSKQARR